MPAKCSRSSSTNTNTTPPPGQKYGKSNRYGGYLVLIVALFVVGNCTIKRELPPPPPSQTKVLYEPEITYLQLKPAIDTRCVPCHGPTRKEGKYDLSTYAGLRGQGTDTTPNAIPGDAKSLLLTALREDAQVIEHRVDTAWKALLERWIVDYQMAYFRSSLHTSDIHLPGTPGFHGALLQQAKWDWKQCTSCHGEDLAGGASGVSCLTCHKTNTPEGCASCHSTTPSTQMPFRSPGTHSPGSVALHQRHFRGMLAGMSTCQTCHPVPTGLRDGVHLDGKVQVQFSQQATWGNQTPQWDAATRTCTATYCHGALSSGTTQAAPRWEAPIPTTTSCTSCHGNPPVKTRKGALHPPDTRCETCHTNAHQDGTIKDPALHINGQVEVSFQGTCQTCHGEDKNPAPPKDLDGNTATTARGVGAHRAHLLANGRNKVVACSDCHTVPTHTFSPGHIDTALPAEVTFGILAGLGELKPTWQRQSNTCSQVYCHGASLAGGTTTQPVWTQVGTGQTGCGSCHGMPPRQTRSGNSHTASTDCHLCHRNIRSDKIFSQPELHINGRVDL